MASRLLMKSVHTWSCYLSRGGSSHIRTSSLCCYKMTQDITNSTALVINGHCRMHGATMMLTNSFHTNPSYMNGKDVNSQNAPDDNVTGGDTVPDDAVVTETYTEDEGRQIMEEQKHTFKTLLDDAQSQNTAADDFNFSEVPQQKADNRTSSKMKIDPSKTSVLLFPGQGAQFVGMGNDLLKYPIVNDMYEVASEILGYDLLALCLNGPKDDLDRTVYCQPAVLVTSLAGIEKLKNEYPQAIENCVATAGFSVGEYAALVFGGVLSFEDAIHLIKIRAESMQRASDAVPSGMISVIGGRGTNYKEICAEAVTHCSVSLKMEKPVCKVANYLFSNARVLAGHKEALKYIIEMKKHFNLRSIKRLPVSGAFHTPLMAPAEEAIGAALQDIDIEEPLIGIHSNVDSKKYMHTKHIRKQLRKQVVEPVMWEQTMGEIYQRKKGDAFPLTYEVGPGNQLGSMLKRFNMKAYQSYYKVDV